MAGRLAIDFGTSNTLVAVWDAERNEGVPFHVPEFGRPMRSLGGALTESISVIPSLIHYTTDRRRWIGQQVLQRNLEHSERTFRWMKRYIANRSPRAVLVDGRRTSHFDAGREFLATVLAVATAELNVQDEEISLTVPVESFEHYDDWLASVAESVGLPRFRLIDEPSAAALGYGGHIQAGHVYLIFDFGGGTLDVAVVLIEESESAALGRRCRVLGKAGADLGGTTIDQWLFQEFLERNQRSDADEDVRTLSRILLQECERAKERLTFEERASITVVHPHTGASLMTEFSRYDLEELLDRHEALTQIDQTIRRAVNAARERGYDEDHIQSVLMVGGSSLIPCVQRTVRRIFGRERVRCERPLDAVARGAAALVAGVDFYDHIQHDYAIQHVDPQTGEYRYRVLVNRGTPYPTSEPVARLTVKATHPGQTQLGIAIYELGQTNARTNKQPLELVFDPSGAARVVEVPPDEEDRRTRFWINEHAPTFLRADPPAAAGQPRFEVEFSVDANKRLLISARDLQTGRQIYRDFPVVKLT